MARISSKDIHSVIRAARNNGTIDKMFLASLNAVIENTQDKREPSKTYKPSSGFKCLREMYYIVVGALADVNKQDSSFIGICESGADRHERLQSYIIKMEQQGIDCRWVDVDQYVKFYNPEGTKVISKCGNEFKCYNNIYNMSFMCDGIIEYKDERYILEIKTETSFKFSSRDSVADDHVTQACCYALCFEIDKVLFIYENRDTCQKKCFLLKIDEEMVQKRVIEPISKCENYIQRMVVPPKPLGKKACTYCNYKDECRRDP